LRKVKFYS